VLASAELGQFLFPYLDTERADLATPFDCGAAYLDRVRLEVESYDLTIKIIAL
jgi:hypothetical protein